MREEEMNQILVGVIDQGKEEEEMNRISVVVMIQGMVVEKS